MKQLFDGASFDGEKAADHAVRADEYGGGGRVAIVSRGDFEATLQQNPGRFEVLQLGEIVLRGATADENDMGRLLHLARPSDQVRQHRLARLTERAQEY
jgi:hypothetical protein